MRKKPIQEMPHPVIPGHSSSDLPCADFLSLSCYDPPAAQSVRMLTRVEPLEELGTWWLPAQQEDALGGSLFFSHGNQGIRLDLIGSFQPSESGMGDRKLESYPLIFGRLSSGSLVTLETCSTIEVREVGLVNTTVTEGIQAGHIYIGDHLPDGGGTICRLVELNFELLDIWARPDGHFANQMQANPAAPGRFPFEYEIPAPVEFEAFGARLSINYGMQLSGDENTHTVSRPIRILLGYQEGQSFRDIEETAIQPLHYLLTLACADELQVLGIRFVEMTAESDRPLTSKWIEAGYLGWKEPSGSSRRWFEMLLPLHAIQDCIEDVAQKWSELYEKADSSLHLFFALFLGPRLYLEARYLFAVQAAEVYHRRCFPNSVIDPDVHEERKRKVLAALKEDSELHQWMKGILHYTNEPPLRDRLTQLVDYGAPATSELLRDNFVQLAVRTRNRLTHYDPSLEGKAAADEDLYWLTEEVISLLECCFLRDLGFEPEGILERMGRTQRARQLSRTRAARSE